MAGAGGGGGGVQGTSSRGRSSDDARDPREAGAGQRGLFAAMAHPGLLGVAQLMLILDVTVVAIALPRIEIDLSLSRAVVTWTVSAYTLTFGGLLLLGGRMADLAGAKRVVLAGLLVFSAASLVTGLAGSPGMLLGGRIAQGVGAALLSPAALSLVVTLFDGAERNKALGVWSALGGGGAALGVLLGGLLTAGPGWPWVFYINVPIGLVIAAAIARMVPYQRAPAPRARLDVLGALLVTASSGVVIYALINAGDDGWLTATSGWLLLLAAAGYLAFVMRQKTAGGAPAGHHTARSPAGGHWRIPHPA